MPAAIRRAAQIGMDEMALTPRGITAQPSSSEGLQRDEAVSELDRQAEHRSRPRGRRALGRQCSHVGVSSADRCSSACRAFRAREFALAAGDQESRCFAAARSCAIQLACFAYWVLMFRRRLGPRGLLDAAARRLADECCDSSHPPMPRVVRRVFVASWLSNPRRAAIPRAAKCHRVFELFASSWFSVVESPALRQTPLHRPRSPPSLPSADSRPRSLRRTSASTRRSDRHTARAARRSRDIRRRFP